MSSNDQWIIQDLIKIAASIDDSDVLAFIFV